MKQNDFARLSIEELLDIRETLNEILSSKIVEERRNLEDRIAALNRFDPSQINSNNPTSLGKLPIKYRNPDNPAEAWTGRGKTPRWMVAAVKKGKRREDFLVANAGSVLKVKNRAH